MEIEKYLEFEPFSLNRKEKDEMFTNLMNNLTYYHYKSCNEYKKFLNFFNYKKKKNKINQFLLYLPAYLRNSRLLAFQKIKYLKLLNHLVPAAYLQKYF